MSMSFSALRRPLVFTAVTGSLLLAAACSGPAEPATPPASQSASASESASASATASSSSSASTGGDVNDALLAAGSLASKEVAKTTVVSIEAERDGWEVHVVSGAGDEQQLRTDASGSQLAAGPTDDRPDAEDRAENKLFAEADVDYKDAVKAVEKDVDGGEIRELSLDLEKQRTVWEADVSVSSEQRTVQIDADSGRVISNRIDD